METKKDLAIVLRAIPYEERHRIITALTENHGQISALARNSIQSRRFGGTLDLFCASEWTFTQKPTSELASLTEAQIRQSFSGLRDDFKKLALASSLSEFMIKLAPPNQACGELFRLHANALWALDQAPSEEIEKFGVGFLNAYLAKILQWNGTQPNLETCLQCKIPAAEISPEREVSCVISDAGWICAECRHRETRHVRERAGGLFQGSLLRLTPPSLYDFQRSLRTPVRQITVQITGTIHEQRQLFRFLEALFVFHLPGFDQTPLKSLRFIGL